jgi:hypothetical protein
VRTHACACATTLRARLPQPDEQQRSEITFHSSIYWAAVTLTTVGYGEPLPRLATRARALSSALAAQCSPNSHSRALARPQPCASQQTHTHKHTHTHTR